MTDKERIEKLEDRVKYLEGVCLNEVPKPQHPEPGTVVEFRNRKTSNWQLGKVSANGNGIEIYVPNTTCYFFGWDKVFDYRPVEILREGEYKVTPPPSELWPKTWQFYSYDHTAFLGPNYSPAEYHWGNHIATVTREQMERKEAEE